jgi:hypothetical protein
MRSRRGIADAARWKNNYVHLRDEHASNLLHWFHYSGNKWGQSEENENGFETMESDASNLDVLGSARGQTCVPKQANQTSGNVANMCGDDSTVQERDRIDSE